MEIIHVSAECYPVAKAGGLGDVVGALPKYQNQAGHIAKVVMPMYRTKFLYLNEFDVDFKGSTQMGNWYFDYTVIKEKKNTLGFDLFLIDINGLLDRQEVYGYDDDAQRFMAFQIAVLHWMSHWQHVPDVVHCHDHQAGLIPFMMKHCYQFCNKLSAVKSIFTIHNAQYQGWLSWQQSTWIPAWDTWKYGLLDWNNAINPLASAVKCAHKVTTVSPTYCNSLKYESNGLEALFEYEKGKCVGILNGIDVEVWNAEKDIFLSEHYTTTTALTGKKRNKDKLCKRFNLGDNLPLIIFIGRLVGEKAADLLPEAIVKAYNTYGNAFCTLILGSGNMQNENKLRELNYPYRGYYFAEIGYNEHLSHLMYAGADFLLMPSRVEPCGLNQLYAMRYGTVPMVRKTGGLQDTVIDYGDKNGYGITFNYASVDDIVYSIGRAIEVYAKPDVLAKMRTRMMTIDNSWENTVSKYDEVYNS